MTKVAIILTSGFADWEYALLAGTGHGFYGLDITYFTPEPGNLNSQGGLAVHVTDDLDRLSAWKPHVVVVVGGTIWESDAAPDIGVRLAELHADGATVAGICGGTLALARAGLFAGAAHTSNDQNFLTQNAPGYAGAENYRNSPAAVMDNRVISSPGTAPVSFTAAVFEAAGLGSEVAGQFRMMMSAEFGT